MPMLVDQNRYGSARNCDDKRGFAKYSWKKLPEIHDDKRGATLNIAELLPNRCDNHQKALVLVA